MQGCALTIVKLAAFQYYKVHNVRPETAEYLFNRKMGKLAQAQKFPLISSPTGVYPVSKGVNPNKGSGLPPKPAPGAGKGVLDMVTAGKGLAGFTARRQGPKDDLSPATPPLVTAPAVATAKKSATEKQIKLARAIKLLVGNRK